MKRIIDPPLRLMCIVGARPNFMKIAPLIRAFSADSLRISMLQLVHTGQHYDEAMKDAFFRRAADSGTGHRPRRRIRQHMPCRPPRSCGVLSRYWIDEFGPHAVLVVGDVNSTIACALVAAKKQVVSVIHVEAGSAQSATAAMPEEINRVLTDQLSDLLFTTEVDGGERNLHGRGRLCGRRIHFVGNVMIDTLAGQSAKGRCRARR